MAMYNETLLQSAETVWDLFYIANVFTGEAVFGLFILAVYLILLMVMKRYDLPDGMFAVSFITFILSAMLTWAGLLNFIFPLLFLTFTAFVALYVFVIRK